MLSWYSWKFFLHVWHESWSPNSTPSSPPTLRVKNKSSFIVSWCFKEIHPSWKSFYQFLNCCYVSWISPKDSSTDSKRLHCFMVLQGDPSFLKEFQSILELLLVFLEFPQRFFNQRQAQGWSSWREGGVVFHLLILRQNISSPRVKASSSAICLGFWRLWYQFDVNQNAEFYWSQKTAFLEGRCSCI